MFLYLSEFVITKKYLHTVDGYNLKIEFPNSKTQQDMPSHFTKLGGKSTNHTFSITKHENSFISL